MKRGGGVGLIAKCGLKFNKIKSLPYKNFELFQANLYSNSKNIRISIIYRTGQLTTSEQSAFLLEYESFLCSLDTPNVYDIVCGDMNIHVNDTNNSFATEFLDLNESLGFLQQIKLPTHTAGNTLDLIFTRESFLPKNIVVYNGIKDEGLSDHFLIKYSFNVKPKVNKSPILFSFRPLKNIDTDKFYMDLQNTMVSPAGLTSTNLNLEVCNLFRDINYCLDKHAPVVTRSKSMSSKLFTNSEIKLARREKRKAERKFLKTLSPFDKIQFKLARKRLIQTVRIGQREFYKNKFCTARGNTKATYQVINHLLYKNQVKALPDIDDKQILATKFLFEVEQ